MIDYTVYYLGAGASAKAIPVVNHLSNRMTAFKGYLSNTINLSDYIFSSESRIPLTPEEVKEKFLKSIDHVVEKSGKNSIDNYARKLWEAKKTEEYDQLKATLSCYLLLEQSKADEQYDIIDHRYDHWLTKITNREQGIPYLKPRFKVISWNYDLQIEKALEELCQFELGSPHYEKWGVYPKMGRYNNGSLTDNEISIVKVNGSTGSYLNAGEVNSLLKSTFREFDAKSVLNALEIYYKFSHSQPSIKQLFFFAWEKVPMAQQGIEIAKTISKKAKELIVIGYSFPDYNKDMDVEILKEMTSLESIYLQVRDDKIEHVRTAMESIFPDIKITVDMKIEQFHVPYF
ncbi:hypothetical protein [Leptospira ilyithenensis]|uniref:SIR2-like domain-containing protein n=1 Tax=Leptospira ilyithenensis TaxID=2484901 RepID=A0A4V3JXC3_9LEPT|nr:hypothetical protein [Leptospira ilyithenensis]TGN14003.1 hypothetical protein EHS11_03205 [Leptospira ilyithenensis]